MSNVLQYKRIKSSYINLGGYIWRFQRERTLQMKMFSIGDRVFNIHRQSCDYSREYRESYHGTILEIHEGCNITIKVKFDGSKFTSILPIQDLRKLYA